MHAMLDIQGVSRRFGPVQANAGLTLSVPVGATVGLLGPNGAGKSTLIRICAGWLRADAGEVWIDGLRQSVGTRATRSRLGAVSLDAPLYPELTVRETLRLQAGLQGLSRAAGRVAMERALAAFQLEPQADRRVGRLSLGLTQRVRLAAATLHGPRLLLLDEPSAILDPEMRHGMWDILRRVQAQGTAILLSTHDLREAALLCGTVHLIVGGCLRRTMIPGAADDAGRRLEAEYLRAVHGEVDAGEAPC